MRQVFISYARADEVVVKQVVARLEGAGVSCWFDQRDIPVSVPWLEEVREAILRSAVFVGCESLHWYASQACLIEKAAADEFGKKIVHIDVVDQDPTIGARLINNAILAQTDNDRAHTDLLVRSSVWDRRGRQKHDLASGVTLRTHRRVANDKNRAFTSTARVFLDASVRRHRQRAWLSRLGGFILVLAALITYVFVGAREEAAKNLANTASTYSAAAAVHERIGRDPYDGMRAATALAAGLDQAGYLGLLGLQDVMNVPVPDRSAELPGARLAGFASGVIASEPSVYAADGHAGPLTSEWPAAVSSVAPSADGAVTVVAGPDGTGARIAGQSMPVPCRGTATISASGKTVGFTDGQTLCVWHPLDGGVRRWQGATGGKMAVTDDYVALGLDTGRLTVFSPTGSVMADVDGEGGITNLAASPDGSQIAIARAGQSSVEVRALATGVLYRSFATKGLVRFSPDARTLAVGRGDSIELWDLATGALRVDLLGGVGTVRELAWTVDGRQLWAIAGEHRLTRWTWRHGDRLFDDPGTWFVALSEPDHNGKFLATTQDGRVIAIDQHDGNTNLVRETTATRVITAVVDTARTKAVLGSAGSILTAELPAGRETRLPVDDCTPVSMTFAKTSTAVIVACVEGDVLAIDTRSEMITARTPVPYGGVSAVAAGPNGEVYVATGIGFVEQTDASLGNLQLVYSNLLDHSYWQDIAVSADGGTVALVGDGTGNVGHTLVGNRGDDGSWKWSRVLVPLRPGQQARSSVVNHDGSRGAIGLSDGTVEYWVPRDGNPGKILTETSGAVRGLSFTSDGSHLVAVTQDGVVDVLPSCPSCGDSRALTADANRVLANAVRMGLTKP